MRYPASGVTPEERDRNDSRELMSSVASLARRRHTIRAQPTSTLRRLIKRLFSRSSCAR